MSLRYHAHCSKEYLCGFDDVRWFMRTWISEMRRKWRFVPVGNSSWASRRRDRERRTRAVKVELLRLWPGRGSAGSSSSPASSRLGRPRAYSSSFSSSFLIVESEVSVLEFFEAGFLSWFRGGGSV